MNFFINSDFIILLTSIRIFIVNCINISYECTSNLIKNVYVEV